MPEPIRAASSSAQGAGIPSQVPQMPRPSLIPRAAVPAPVLTALEKIAARGAEYEAVARLSAETIASAVGIAAIRSRPVSPFFKVCRSCRMARASATMRVSVASRVRLQPALLNT